MRFRSKKQYGQSKLDRCSFCSSIATQTTKEGVLVCRHHLQQKMQDIQCTCGSWLEQKSGKFGPYFTCFNCGNINFNKALEMKALMPVGNKNPLLPITKQSIKKEESFEERENRIRREERRGKETTITSNDVEYFS